jgi:tetratricopeptide (TPR) repeat protein
MRRSPITVVLTASLAILGCHVHGTGGAAPPPVAEPAAPQEPALPGDPAPLAIGWTEILGAPDAAAQQQHRKGLAQHEAGRCEAALASFERALAIEPDLAWARYHRARALACLGRSDDAVLELERLVLEDLPTFGPRWAGDEALAAVRATAEGQELDARLPAIREAYRQAIATGVPAMTYHAREPRDAEGQPRIPQEDLRLGVYEPATRRFVVFGALLGRKAVT